MNTTYYKKKVAESYKLAMEAFEGGRPKEQAYQLGEAANYEAELAREPI